MRPDEERPRVARICPIIVEGEETFEGIYLLQMPSLHNNTVILLLLSLSLLVLLFALEGPLSSQRGLYALKHASEE